MKKFFNGQSKMSVGVFFVVPRQFSTRTTTYFHCADFGRFLFFLLVPDLVRFLWFSFPERSVRVRAGAW